MRYILFILLVISILFCTHSSFATMAFDGSGDHGNINPTGSSIVGTTITVQPRILPEPGKWYEFFFKLTGANGQQPTFQIVWANHISIPLASLSTYYWRPCWTTTPDDLSSWQFATSFSTDSTYATFTFPTAFSADTVYVAFQPVVRESYIPTWIASLDQTLVSQPASAIAFGGDPFQVGVVPASTDELGNTIPALKQYGLKIGTGSKILVIISGQHACEPSGPMMAISLVNFLTSANWVAQMMRDAFTIYVYPMVNVQGYYAGQTQYTWEAGNTTINCNRDWSVGGFKLVTTTNIKNAIQTDTGGTFDAFFDLHAWWGTPDGQVCQYAGSATETNWLANFNTYYETSTSFGTTYTTTSTDYYKSVGTISIVLESSVFDTQSMNTCSTVVSRMYTRAICALCAINRTYNISAAGGVSRYGIDFGGDNTTRYYTASGNSAFDLPNSDWSMGFWVKIDDNSGSNTKYPVGFNTVDTANSYWVNVTNASASPGNRIQFRARDATGSATTWATSTISDIANGVPRHVLIQRIGANLEIWVTSLGALPQRLYQGALGSIGAVTCGSSVFYLGSRNDLSTTRMYTEHLSGLWKGNFSIARRWDIEGLSMGLAHPRQLGTVSYMFPLTSPAATITDVVSGLVLTQYGSSWPAVSAQFPSFGWPYTIGGVSLPSKIGGVHSSVISQVGGK